MLRSATTAKYLVAAALGGQLAPSLEKSWDVLG